MGASEAPASQNRRMIVPSYWAEARRQYKKRTRDERRQVTVRRFGWSDASQSDAQAMAERRAEEALERILGGEPLERREPRVPYNGAEGVPIREEILARHGSSVITRNSYGAHCLNTPDVLFADLDFNESLGCLTQLAVFVAIVAASLSLGATIGHWGAAVGAFVALLFLWPSVARTLERLRNLLIGNAEKRARRRIHKWLTVHPEWRIAVYRTPAGLRLLALHKRYSARSDEVREFFTILGTDPIYARMCVAQNCFRARLTGKPWRMGVPDSGRIRTGAWPVHESVLPIRNRWIEGYERLAPAFAACQFEEILGSHQEDSGARAVRELHDELSGAQTERPLA
jgi:hypothetical protein